MGFRPTVEEVIAIHDAETPQYELRDRLRLEAALEAPWQSAGQVDAYPSVHDKAAVLYRGIDKGQPFEDGYELASYVAETHEPDLNHVAQVFARWCTPVDPPEGY